MRTALLMVCTSTMAVAPLALLAQTTDAPPASQQGPPDGGTASRGMRMEERQIERMTKQLSLTPDQVTKLKAIDDASRQQLMALHDDMSTPREQKRPKMEAIRKDQQDQVKAMLSDEQKTKYEAMEAKMRERREENSEEGDEAPPPPSTPQV